MTPLAMGEGVVAIDFRPSTGALYGLSVNGTNGQLIVINTNTGALTPVGAPFTINGTSFGFDFNPTVDRIRVVSDTGFNVRLVPDTGVVVADSALAYAAGDVNQGNAPTVSGSAYTNNLAGAAVTSLYGIDFTRDVLVRAAVPNAGTLSTIGSLAVNAVSVGGFDIGGAGTQTGLAVMSLVATPTLSTLFQVNLTTGAATSLGVISSTETVTGLAIDAPTLIGLTSTGALVRFNALRPGVVLSTVALSGLAVSETMVGIDVRPLTGALFGVASTSRVYTIDPNTGACTGVGMAPTALVGTVFGVDFNPVVDRLRVTSDADQNLRLNPGTGALVSLDPALNPGNPNVIEVAYTNNESGLGFTTQLALESGADALASIDTANTGTLTTIGALGIDIGGSAGFDVDQVNVGWAAVQVAGAPSSALYSIDVRTGLASLVGPIGGGVRLIGMTVALQPAPQAVAIVGTNNLIRFVAHDPSNILSTLPVTGLAASENIVGLDTRPIDGVLYAVTDQARMYTIALQTGAATAVSATPFTMLSGTEFGMDFNPTVDRIRLTSNTGQNLRLNQATGLLAATDTALNYPVGDVNMGAMPAITGVAYSENAPGVTRTTLYGVDASLRVLVRIGGVFGSTSPNSGVLSTIAPLTTLSATSVSSFDIGPSGTAYLLRNGTAAELSVVNLANGVCRFAGSAFPPGMTARAFTVLRSP